MRFPRSVLAAWRLVELVHDEEGPYRVVARFREWAGPSTVLKSIDGGPVTIVEQVGFRGEIAKAVECKWCLSIWAGLAVALLDRTAPLIVDALATSGAAILVVEGRERLSSEHGASNSSDVAESR